MKIKWIRPILVLAVLMLAGLAACKRVGVEPTPAAPTPTHAIPTPTYTLATPYAKEPAAGICASFEGELVKVTLNPDVPDPRCTIVRTDQKLTVINNTQNILQISIGRFTASLEPGKETIIDTPFGEYLAPGGVHQLQVSPCCGSELWLKDK